MSWRWTGAREMAKFFSNSKLADLVHSLPLLGSPVATMAPESRDVVARSWGDRQMGAREQMLALEEKVRRYEEELVRLRVENEQLRRSSQAFGELAERLSTALRTATRVNRKAGTEIPGRLHALPES
jgi:hypothetical protein